MLTSGMYLDNCAVWTLLGDKVAPTSAFLFTALFEVSVPLVQQLFTPGTAP